MQNAASIGELSATVSRLGHQYPMLAAKRAGAELFGAPRLNAFSLFQPNEVRLSRIIADLFDPRGTHGQDILFLNALLRMFDCPLVSVIDQISVKREAVTQTRRQIDLVIETPKVILGIENKPWAAQQPDQLADYLAALKAWCSATAWRQDKEPVLIFLSNMDPETAQDEVCVLRLHSNDEPSLNRILEWCIPEIRAPRTQTHVTEMIAYLATHFGDQPMTADADRAYVEAVEAEYGRGPGNRRALAMAMLSQGKLHEILLCEISERILCKARGLFSDIEEEGTHGSLSKAIGAKDQWWGFRRPTWPDNCSIAITSARQQFGEICFGVHAPEPNNLAIDKAEACVLQPIIRAAVAGVEGGSSSAWWPWWKWAEPITWSPERMGSLLLESSTGHVADHPCIEDMVERMLTLAKSVDEALENA